ncbi:MAG: hypothetical protein FWG35_06205 [Spirochaetaceae bacterium]|nr:hypothetical protein [Spirochaetaceae bacterium]
MGLLKRLLQEKKEGGLLNRAVTLKNYEFESAQGGAQTGGKKKDLNSSVPKASPTPKKK